MRGSKNSSSPSATCSGVTFTSSGNGGIPGAGVGNAGAGASTGSAPVAVTEPEPEPEPDLGSCFALDFLLPHPAATAIANPATHQRDIIMIERDAGHTTPAESRRAHGARCRRGSS